MRLKALFFLLLLSAPLWGELPLQGEFWSHRDFAFFPENIEIWPGLEKQNLEPDINRIYKSLLSEARWVYSGMIYGFDFNFSPADHTHGGESEFLLEPKQMLDWGDPRMKAGEIFIQEKMLYCRILYYPDFFQTKWMTTWKNRQAYTGTGAGSSPFLMSGSRQAAMKNSVKGLLVKYFKEKEGEKPQRVTGEAAFLSVPEISLRAGQINAVSRCVIDIGKIIYFDDSLF